MSPLSLRHEVDQTALQASQSSQLPGPSDALYFPATHSVQGPPTEPVEPALQTQTELPVGALDPAGQIKHESDPTAPTVSE